MVTFDHEHVPAELLDKLVAEGVVLAPPPQALVHAQDKLVMRRRLQALDVPVPRYLGIHQLEELGELDAFARQLDAPLVVKAVRAVTTAAVCRWRAIWPMPATSPAATWPGCSGAGRGAGPVASRALGAGGTLAVRPGAAWPVVETVQQDGICVAVIAPAPALSAQAGADAQQLALRLAAELAWSGCSPWNSSRPPTALWWSTSSRCGRTIPGTGPWTDRAPASSSSTYARCWTTRSAIPRRSRR
ncbi:ATP-grasp domain protein [Mycobacterium ulcerans str. Harvey]|uniref:ATP-grasp domain protein n=1 Tax=Mycobacterium ulcerans str. Harvey TaxID=1299332 RepID=A0ABP3AFC0_MYCUL|nr:ATP-grasp domain protein [Mycobacterium ulcerans str. Harvey]